MKIRSVGFVSALIYTGISVLAAGTFFVVTLAGNYNWLTVIGGAGWVFMLSMIILMPIVTPMIKRKMQSP